MADEIVAPIAPVESSPVVAPVIPASQVETPVVSPDITPTAVVEPVQASPAEVVPIPETPKEPAPSILSEALKEPEAPKVEPVVEPVKDEGGQSVEPAPPPKYDAWTLPEGISLEEASVGEFTNLLSSLELEGKADHAKVQEFGQKAVEFYINESKKNVQKLEEHYANAWEKQKTDWREATIKDPEIGGNRLQTTLDSASTFIRTHGGTAEQQTEFRSLMDSSGLGNHPAIVRLLANAGRAMSEGRPLAALKPVTQKQSRTSTMYGPK